MVLQPLLNHGTIASSAAERVVNTTTVRCTRVGLWCARRVGIYTLDMLAVAKCYVFPFRAFGTRLYPKRLATSTCVEGHGNLSLWYIKIGMELFSSIPSLIERVS